jgi:hypothetical protein
MIPTLLLAGILFGRWWRVSIPVGSIGWAILLASTGVVSGLGGFVSAALFAFVNVTIGVLVFQGTRSTFRVAAPRHQRARP